MTSWLRQSKLCSFFIWPLDLNKHSSALQLSARVPQQLPSSSFPRSRRPNQAMACGNGCRGGVDHSSGAGGLAGSVTSALVVGSSAAVSSILVYLAWTSLVSWHVFQEDDSTSATGGGGGSTIGRDPLVWALMSVAGVAVCETSVLVSWLWRPSRNARGRRPGVGSFLRWASFHLTVFGLAFQLAATFYLLLMDVKFPGLHQIHPASGITISTQKRPITRILHDEHPHQACPFCFFK